MASIKRYKTLYNAQAATTGNWFPLDVRYDINTQRIIQVTLTSSDTIVLEGTTHDVRGIDKSFLTTLPASEISTITTISASGPYLLEGPWTYIRARKTGTTAVATVQGFI